MPDLVWPSGLFVCAEPRIWLEGRPNNSGTAIDGAPGQLVDTSRGGFWKVQLGCQLRSKEAVLAAESWRSALQTGVRSVILPLRQVRNQHSILGSDPATTVEASAWPLMTDFNPGSYTDDIWVNIVEPSAKYGTSVTLDCDNTIYGGKFCVEEFAGKWRIYDLIIKTGSDASGQIFTVSPPLREALSGDEPGYMSYIFLTVRVDREAGGIEINYHDTTRGYATMTANFMEVR